MKTRLVVISVVLASAAAWVGACTPQPPLPCPIQTSNPYFGLPPFAVFYTLKTGTGACATKELEAFGFQKYNKPGTTETHVGIRPGDLGTYFEDGRSDPTDLEGKKVNAIGDLTEEPDSSNLCTITFEDADSNHAEQNFEAIADDVDADGGIIPGEPALSIKYEWTSLKVIASAAVPGSAFMGELKYTEDGCTAVYEAEGFWPEVACDPAAHLVAGASSNDLPDGGMLEDLDCASGQDVPNGHTLGSGINPDFKVVCDDTPGSGSNGVCVLGTRDRASRTITRGSVNDLTKL